MFHRKDLLKEKEELEAQAKQLDNLLTHFNNSEDFDYVESYPVIDLTKYKEIEDFFIRESFDYIPQNKKGVSHGIIKIIAEVLGFFDSFLPIRLFGETTSSQRVSGDVTIRFGHIKYRIRRRHRAFTRLAKQIDKKLRGSIRIIDFRTLTRVFQLNIFQVYEDEDLIIVATSSNYKQINIIKYEKRIFRPII